MMGLGDRQAKVVGRDTQLIHRCPRTHSSYTGVQGHTARTQVSKDTQLVTGVQGHTAHTQVSKDTACRCYLGMCVVTWATTHMR